MGGSAGHPRLTAALCCTRRFVSDQAPRGMAALCQHKLLGALEQTQLAPGSARAHPPTQLEWTAGWRRGRMALDVSTFSGEARLLLRAPAAESAWHPRPPRPPSRLSPPDVVLTSRCDLDLPAILLVGPPRDSTPFPVRVDPAVPHCDPRPSSLQRSATRPRWSPGPQGSSSPGGFYRAGLGAGNGGVWPTLTIVPPSS